MRTCTIEGCTKRHEARGYCETHYARLKRLGDPRALKTSPRGSAVKEGYRIYGTKLAHVAVAEAALGKPLPSGAVVHHWDEDRSNNEPSNLLICSRAYHMTIHARMRAMSACGNPNWVLCRFCRQYDDPARLYITAGKRSGYHNKCRQFKAALQKGIDVQGARLVQGSRVEIK